MTKKQFLSLMRFPDEWEYWGMYPDVLFNWQIAGYVPGHEEGAEHDRNGAFHWWLRQHPTKAQLAKLLKLTYLDPDSALGQDVRKYIYRASGFDEELAELERSLSNPAG
ncbi:MULTISPECIES: hypothetical protein [Methylocaldum]|jgi:hypothetical protein|uniref:hypothetical protein n=1 Tax=Methylocaldum sp. RMAD-M TaxID=2806557 RepID=UPI000A320A1D|nr:hypothetical protein [Methylocaldum sp. RMAD-M]MBP1152171.1 hypothetical protein [Methylocaldum sp. RMAD-M]MVF24466.1 hypothetical protein [Methylocaldum sp. BRCS4]